MAQLNRRGFFGGLIAAAILINSPRAIKLIARPELNYAEFDRAMTAAIRRMSARLAENVTRNNALLAALQRRREVLL